MSSLPSSDPTMRRRNPWGDRLFRGAAFGFALLVFLLMASIILMLLFKALPAFEAFGIGFLWSAEWNPVTHQYGALIAIVGTLASSAIAIAIAVPVSFGIALFIAMLAPQWLRRPVGMAIELLAAVPSIIYGMWGLFYFAPWFADNVQPWMTQYLGAIPYVGAMFQGPPIGISVMTAGIVLAIMIIPFIASVMRDVFEIVPRPLTESAYAMGSTTWEVVWKVVLPYTRVGVVGGIMLGLGRALGETMAVTFVIGNAHNLSLGLFEPGNTIASTLANEFNEASGLQLSSLIALGLVLFMVTFVVLGLSKLMLLRLGAREGKYS